MSRVVLLLIVLVFPLMARATVSFAGPPHPIGPDKREATLASVSALGAVSTSWGYVAAWVEIGSLRLARVGNDGTLLDDPALRLAQFDSGVVQLATDGTDVLVAYTHTEQYAKVHRLARLTADGHLLPVRTLAEPPSAIVWTGKSYIVYVGGCSPREALQLDREGNLVRSIALRSMVRNCDPLAALSYRDPAGIVRLIVQVTTPEVENQTWRLALTDENGDPVRDGVLELLDARLSGTHFRAAGATRDGIYLLSDRFVQFADHFGRPTSPLIPFDAFQAQSAASGDDVIVSGTTGPEQRELVAWRITSDGTTRQLWPGPAGRSRKVVTALFATPTGAAAFLIGPGPTMTFVRNEERGSRLRRPIALARSIPDRRELAAVAHGQGMLVAWTHRTPDPEVQATLLDSSARPVPMFPIAISGDEPRIASNGEVALIVAHTTGGANVVRIDRDGRALDRVPRFFPGLQVLQAMWDGSAFLLHVFPSHGLRIDQSGNVLTPEPLPLTNAPILFPTSLGVSSRGALFVFSANRLPRNNLTRALFAQSLTRDLQPIGEPRLISVVSAEGEISTLWRGEDYILVYPSLAQLRSLPVSENGEPLDGDLPRLISDASGDFQIALAGNRQILATQLLLTELGTRPVMSTRMGDAAHEIGGIVTTRDGRTWLFYTTIDSSDGLIISRPFAREIAFE